VSAVLFYGFPRVCLETWKNVGIQRLLGKDMEKAKGRQKSRDVNEAVSARGRGQAKKYSVH